jgi:hypothetical protein
VLFGKAFEVFVTPQGMSVDRQALTLDSTFSQFMYVIGLNLSNPQHVIDYNAILVSTLSYRTRMLAS